MRETVTVLETIHFFDIIQNYGILRVPVNAI